MLPEKHPTVPNAHSKFEEVITAFVQVKIQKKNTKNSKFDQLIGQLKSSGENITALMPGDIFVSNFQCSIHLQPGAGNAWKKAIRYENPCQKLCAIFLCAIIFIFRQTYPDVIVGSQKQSQNLNMKESST